MYTRIDSSFKGGQNENELEAILRSCVHCGFCNATCPTYLITGVELEGPRGRIYLMKQMLEGQPVTRLTQTHLDRCLTCLSCETTCPSGVKYGQLLDAGRVIVDKKVGRSFSDSLIRRLMLSIFPYRKKFDALLTVAGWIRPVLPGSLKRKIPAKAMVSDWPDSMHSRTMLSLPGCVQQSLAPSIDYAAARVLDKLGISLQEVGLADCCGALPYHLSAHERALKMARHNIDTCMPYLDQGAEAIVSTASGCGVMAKDYGRLLKNDPDYAEKAARFSAAVKDISEVLAGEDLSGLNAGGKKIAFHSPCTLQHGQKLTGLVESILERTGFQLTVVDNPHVCCGSAGVYSLLQPDFSGRLLNDKINALEVGQPEMIATANIGCLSQLRSAESKKNIVHWIELLV